MFYKVFQITLNGNEVEYQSGKFSKVSMPSTIDAAIQTTQDVMEHFTHTQTIKADSLAEMFTIGNGMSDVTPMWRSNTASSISVGNVIIDSDGNGCIVMPVSWAFVTREFVKEFEAVVSQQIHWYPEDTRRAVSA
jgi:hypothetical protein